jgi:hypothetical protein
MSQRTNVPMCQRTNDEGFAIFDLRFVIGMQSPIANQQLAIADRQSPIGNRQSKIGNL